MAFDPDAYLAGSDAPAAPGGFDPDAYLATRSSARVTPEPAPKPHLLQQAINSFKPYLGALETGVEMATSVPAQALGGYAGIAGSLLPGDQGQGAKWSENVANALTYRPMTKSGQDISAAVAYPFEKANEGLGYVGEKVGGDAGRTIGENLIPAVGTVVPGLPKARKATANRIQSVLDFRENAKKESAFPVRDEATGEITYYRPEEVRYARENAPMIEAGQVAQDMGIKINPAKTNPTKENLRLAGRATEKHLDAALAKENEKIWGNVIRDEMGIAKDRALTPDVIAEVQANAAVPAQAIAEQGGLMAPTADQLATVRSLRRESTIASPEIAGQTDSLVNRALGAIENGADASQLLREIADLRSDANKFYEAKGGGPEMAEKARTYKKIANTLEDMVQSNLETLARQDPYGKFAEMAKAYPEARTKMAQSYVLKNVTDFNTGKIDPIKLAKMTADDTALTGRFQDVGKVTGNFPESAVATASEPGFFETRYSRASAPALAGALAGAVLPIPGGMATGSILGMATGEALGRQATRKLMGESGQAGAANRVPRSLWDMSDQDPLTSRYNFDREPISREFSRAPDGQPPMLPPPAPPAGPRGPVSDAPAPYRHPNFQFGENNPPQPAPPGTAMTRGRPLTPEEQFAQDKANFAAQDRTQYNREAALDALAQQKAEAEAAALRRPASRERVLDLNPMTGRLEPTSRGLPGATPETIRSTGNALESATNKLAEGRAFDMTLEEKAAWKHTRTSLIEGVPELRGMTERQIFDRIQDRQWVADTIKKLREKDIAFEGIKRTADENAARSAATKQRELLADQLEALQAQFDAMPLRQEPKTQGPKTRDAKRKFAGNDATIVVNELRRR